jgi:hypothetical protein
MADQKRWFKVWASILADPHFGELELEDVGRWALLGAYMAMHGTHGTLTVPGEGRTFCSVLRVTDLKAARAALERLPNVTVDVRANVHETSAETARNEEGQNRYGEFTVTLRNWRTYQDDSTARERMKTLRSKRRGEERRRDKRRNTPLRGVEAAPADGVTAPDEHGASNGAGPPAYRIPGSVVDALDRAPVLGKVRHLREPAWWQAELRANAGIDPGAEVLKAEAHLATHPGRAITDRGRQQFLHNWLKRAERVEA